MSSYAIRIASTIHAAAVALELGVAQTADQAQAANG